MRLSWGTPSVARWWSCTSVNALVVTLGDGWAAPSAHTVARDPQPPLQPLCDRASRRGTPRVLPRRLSSPSVPAVCWCPRRQTGSARTRRRLAPARHRSSSSACTSRRCPAPGRVRYPSLHHPDLHHPDLRRSATHALAPGSGPGPRPGASARGGATGWVPRRCRCPGRWRTGRWAPTRCTRSAGCRGFRCRGRGTRRRCGCRTRSGRRWCR